MTHSLLDRIAVLLAVFGAAGLGWMAKGFAELDALPGLIGCVASVILFAALVWEITDA